MNNYRQNLIDRIDTPVKQREVFAGTIKTTYLSAGQGIPVILIHGGGGGAVTWHQSIAAIAKHFQVIAPDVVGYGESDKPDAEYDRPYYSAWLRHFLTELNIGKAHIVGLSQGGAVALQFATDYPQTVDKLILVDSAALGGKPPFLSFISMLWMNSFPSRIASRFFSRYLLFDSRKRDTNLTDYSIAVIKKPGGKNAFFQGKGRVVSPIPVDQLRRINSETLLIWGEDDKFFSAETAQQAVKVLPNAKLRMLKNAGHLSLTDQPKLFNRVVLDFLGVAPNH